MAYAEIENSGLDLAAYRARRSEPARSSIDLLLRAVPISVGTHRRVRFGHASRTVRHLSLPPQLLHAGTHGREIIGSAGSVHGVSSQLGRVLVAQYGLRAGARRG